MREIEASQMKIDSEKSVQTDAMWKISTLWRPSLLATNSRKSTQQRSAMPSVRVTNRYLWCF